MEVSSRLQRSDHSDLNCDDQPAPITLLHVEAIVWAIAKFDALFPVPHWGHVDGSAGIDKRRKVVHHTVGHLHGTAVTQERAIIALPRVFDSFCNRQKVRCRLCAHFDCRTERYLCVDAISGRPDQALITSHRQRPMAIHGSDHNPAIRRNVLGLNLQTISLSEKATARRRLYVKSRLPNPRHEEPSWP